MRRSLATSSRRVRAVSSPFLESLGFTTGTRGLLDRSDEFFTTTAPSDATALRHGYRRKLQGLVVVLSDGTVQDRELLAKREILDYEARPWARDGPESSEDGGDDSPQAASLKVGLNDVTAESPLIFR
jgi:hypothetical protein